MTTRNMQPTTLTLAAIQRPKTLLTRLIAALVDGDSQRALSVLAAASERRALPRRLLFGRNLDGGCRRR